MHARIPPAAWSRWASAMSRVIVLMVLLVLVAASSVVAAPSDSTGPDDSPIPSALPAQAGSSVMAPDDAHVPALAGRKYSRWLRGLGFDKEAVAYFAGTRSSVTEIDAHTYEVHHTFPDGTTADLTYHLVQDTGMDPADWPTLTVAPDGATFQIRYSVATNSIPKDMRSRILDGLPVAGPTESSTASPVALSSPFMPVQGLRLAQAGSSVGVVVDSALGEARDTLIEKALDPSNVGGSEVPSKGLTALKFVSAAVEHVQDQAMYKDAQDKIDRLEDCAKEPTNPLTEKAYRENPAEQKRVIESLQNARSETTADAVVTTVMTLTGPASSLANEASGLGFIVGPLKDLAKHTLKKVLEERVRVAEQEVVPCRLNFKISGSAPTVTFSGKACDIERPFKVGVSGDIKGTITFTPHTPTFGRWSFDGREVNAGFGITGSGDYSVKLSEDRSSGSLDFKFSITIHRPIGGNQAGGGRVSLTLSKIPPC
jgi:hypothetical protein